jgi:hypothetical protein
MAGQMGAQPRAMPIGIHTIMNSGINTSMKYRSHLIARYISANGVTKIFNHKGSGGSSGTGSGGGCRGG